MTVQSSAAGLPDHAVLCAALVLRRRSGLPSALRHQLLERLAAGEVPTRAAELPDRHRSEWLRLAADESVVGEAEAVVRWCAAAPARHVLWLGAAGYPSMLRNIPDPPPLLLLEGRCELLERHHVAVVGSRRCSRSGVANARNLAAGLAELGFVVTSGLARGIDGAAHVAALEVGGDSVAVLGCGPDRVYPRAHAALDRRLREQGLVISEQLPGTPPLPAHFPLRNRIISGLSVAVLVVEAAVDSGSLITARLAGEQGREVLAVPGPISLDAARGCHRLIRDGATLVEDVQQVLEALPVWCRPEVVEPVPAAAPSGPVAQGQRREQAQESVAPGEQRLLACLDGVPISVEGLVDRTALSAGDIAAMLVRLELRGRIRREAGGYVLA